MITFIDTGGHGYYKFSIAYLKKLEGFDPEKVSKYSGLSLTHLYAEEDADAAYIFGLIDKKPKVKTVYQSKTITHNYNPKLFGYTPKFGDKVKLCNGEWGDIFGEIGNKGWRVATDTGIFRLPKRNLFDYLIDVQ